MDQKLVLTATTLAALFVLATAGGGGDGGKHKVVLEVPTHVKEHKHIHTVYKIVKVPAKKEKRSHDDHFEGKVEHSGKFMHLHQHKHDHGEFKTAPQKHFVEIAHYHNGAVKHGHDGAVNHHHVGKVGHHHKGDTYHKHGGDVGHHHKGNTHHSHKGDVGHHHKGDAYHKHGGDVGHHHKGDTHHSHKGDVGHLHKGDTHHSHGGHVGHFHKGATHHSHGGEVGHHYGKSHGGYNAGYSGNLENSHDVGHHYGEAEDTQGYYSEPEPDHEGAADSSNNQQDGQTTHKYDANPAGYSIGSSGHRISSGANLHSFNPHDSTATYGETAGTTSKQIELESGNIGSVIGRLAYEPLLHESDDSPHQYKVYENPGY